MILFALSEAGEAAIIAGVFSTLASIIGLVGAIAVLWFRMKGVKDDVQKIEKATNSMKDALVLATEKEALVRGGVEERARADAKLEKKEAQS